MIHVGDGATDLEACPPADAFIGNILKFLKFIEINLYKSLSFGAIIIFIKTINDSIVKI